MAKITFMLLIPLIPSVLLFVAFPESLFGAKLNGIPGTHAVQITSSGAVGLYFCLILLSIKLFKTDRLDAKTEYRVKMLGNWSFEASSYERAKSNRMIPRNYLGTIDFSLDPETQRLRLSGSSNGQNFGTDKIFIDPQEVTYLIDTNQSGDNRQRWLVELILPADRDINNLSGNFHEIEGDTYGTISLTRNRKRSSLAKALMAASGPVTAGVVVILCALWYLGGGVGYLVSHMQHIFN